ncbi:MAG: hypothetical protein L0H15_12670, partial [Nitrosospira sp.]|nr:hypothetical protein [Nitrosospira sp.]
MKYYWRIALASAIATLPLSSVHAIVNGALLEKSQVTRQEARQAAQYGISGSDKWLLKSSENTYKWAIKPSEDNYKWAIPSP